ncbi:MAG: hypothetical protein V1779_08480 [bacterium]
MEMNLAVLLKDSSRATIDKATEETLNDRKLFNKMLYLALNENSKYSLRASRVLYFCTKHEPNLIEPHLNDILTGLKTVKNDSIRGNLLSVFYEIELPYNEEFLGELTQVCFELLNGQSERESLAVYSIDVLYKICKFYPELKNELIQNLQALLPHKKAAFFCRANETLKKLKK